MFVEDADMECLRQGDILRDVPFPLLDTSKVVFIGKPVSDSTGAEIPGLVGVSHTHRDDPNWLTAQIPVRLSFCAVLSQCCDLEPRNERIVVPAFLVARLRPIPKSILSNPQQLASLRRNKDPRNTADPGYINLFHIQAHPTLGNNEWIVDYNQAMALPNTEFPDILRKKLLQMDNESRVKFKIKLAMSLARLTEEEHEAGLENPWLGKQAPIKFPE